MATNGVILTPFPVCIKALSNSLVLDSNVELVVTDWESTDWPIKEWIEEVIPYIPITLVTIKADGFSAGKGRNIAAKYATGNNIFFLDADIIVNHETIDFGLIQCENNKVYYPTVKYETELKGKQIIHEGGGNLFICKDIFNKIGPWPEYWNHGWEDVKLVDNIKKANIPIVTNDKISIFHQWHPDGDWKKHNVKDDLYEQTKEHYHEKQIQEEWLLKKELNSIISKDANITHNKLNNVARI